MPWGLIGAFCLVAGVESYLARRDVDFTNPILSGWALSREPMVGREIRAAEVLCLGDSLLKSGLVPRLLEARLGKPSYNGALVAGQPALTYFLLRRALRDGARPSALLVDFSPHFLCRPPNDPARWAESATPWECGELAWEARDVGFLAEAMAGHLLRSYRRRPQIQANLFAALRGEEPTMPDAVRADWRNWNANRGAFLLPQQLDARDLDDDQRRQLVPSPWSCHPSNAAYLRRLLALAAAHEVPVYWVLPPVGPQVLAWREHCGLELRHTIFILETLASFPDVVVLDARYSGYRHAAFADMIHLNVRGASAFSDDVATALRAPPPRGLPARRWVVMPAYRERAIDVPLEDLDQSAIALRSAPGRLAR